MNVRVFDNECQEGDKSSENNIFLPEIFCLDHGQFECQRSQLVFSLSGIVQMPWVALCH